MRLDRRRLALLACAAAPLLAACGGRGGDDAAATTTSSTAEAIADAPCSILDMADISSVTGVAFDRATPATNQCAYTSSTGRMAVVLDLRAVEDATTRLAKDRAGCDAGTTEDESFAGAAGGFSCRIGDVPTVVAIGGDDIEVILTARTLDGRRDLQAITGHLVTILEHAIAAAG